VLLISQPLLSNDSLNLNFTEFGEELGTILKIFQAAGSVDFITVEPIYIGFPLNGEIQILALKHSSGADGLQQVPTS